MYDFLLALEKSRLFYVSRLELRVMPEYRSLALTGFVRLRKYGEFKHAEKRFEGEESRQVKAALKKTLPSPMVVEVKSSPDLKAYSAGAYEFSVTQSFASSEEKQSELRLLREKGAIGEHVYPLSRTLQEKISGNAHSH